MNLNRGYKITDASVVKISENLINLQELNQFI
jgi:hypothetical protein